MEVVVQELDGKEFSHRKAGFVVDQILLRQSSDIFVQVNASSQIHQVVQYVDSRKQEFLGLAETSE